MKSAFPVSPQEVSENIANECLNELRELFRLEGKKGPLIQWGDLNQQKIHEEQRYMLEYWYEKKKAYEGTPPWSCLDSHLMKFFGGTTWHLRKVFEFEEIMMKPYVCPDAFSVYFPPTNVPEQALLGLLKMRFNLKTLFYYSSAEASLLRQEPLLTWHSATQSSKPSVSRLLLPFKDDKGRVSDILCVVL
jgi:hypothetical protein